MKMKLLNPAYRLRSSRKKKKSLEAKHAEDSDSDSSSDYDPDKDDGFEDERNEFSRIAKIYTKNISIKKWKRKITDN